MGFRYCVRFADKTSGSVYSCIYGWDTLQWHSKDAQPDHKGKRCRESLEGSIYRLPYVLSLTRWGTWSAHTSPSSEITATCMQYVCPEKSTRDSALKGFYWRHLLRGVLRCLYIQSRHCEPALSVREGWGFLCWQAFIKITSSGLNSFLHSDLLTVDGDC